VFSRIYVEPDALPGVRSAPIVPKFVPKFSIANSYRTRSKEKRETMNWTVGALLHLAIGEVVKGPNQRVAFYSHQFVSDGGHLCRLIYPYSAERA
jgi:hypothetical protein